MFKSGVQMTNNPVKNHKTFDLAQQKSIILQMLEQAKNKSTKDIQVLLENTQKKLDDKSIVSMKQVIHITNLLIATLDNYDEAQPTLDFLKEKGLYRMLYRYPKFKGEELPKDDILHQLLRNGFIGIGVSALFIVAFVTTMFIGAPFWLMAIASGLFVGSSVYLSGLLYGVVNDLFATQANLPYFLLGHQEQQTSLLRTNDKVAQGVAWGIAATFGPVIIATILFSVAATITAFFVPIATFLLPILMFAMPLIALGAEFYARKKTKEYSILSLSVGNNKYQKDGLEFMSPSPNERAAWHANSDRNIFGFTRVPLIGLAALVVLITLSAVSMFLPAVLFASPLIAVIVPAACAAFAVLALTIGGIYTYINRNRHIDDRNNLEFERESINYDLYLNEDMDYVNGLLKVNKSTLTSKPEASSKERPHHPPLFSSLDTIESLPIQSNQESKFAPSM